MSAVAPSTPTIPPPSPLLRERRAGQRLAVVRERLRRPSRPGLWVRPGAPSASRHLRARHGTPLRRALRIGLVTAVLGAGLVLAAAGLNTQRLEPMQTHAAEYDALASHIREARFQLRQPVWRLPVTSTHSHTRGQMGALGVRYVEADRSIDAFLFRPGGVGDELAYAHVGRPFSADELRRSAFGAGIETTVALGNGWYRVVGRWPG